MRPRGRICCPPCVQGPAHSRFFGDHQLTGRGNAFTWDCTLVGDTLQCRFLDNGWRHQQACESAPTWEAIILRTTVAMVTSGTNDGLTTNNYFNAPNSLLAPAAPLTLGRQRPLCTGYQYDLWYSYRRGGPGCPQNRPLTWRCRRVSGDFRGFQGPYRGLAGHEG